MDFIDYEILKRIAESLESIDNTLKTIIIEVDED